MTDDRSIHETIARLFRRTVHGIRPGLEVMRALLERMGNPERSLVCLHVAGTNGKGSVCAMIESVLRAAGLRTGLYTSPHLASFRERFRADGTSIDDGTLAVLAERALALAEGLERTTALPRPATFFELSTAMAFEYFKELGVDVAVIETGMGGRWDATNVIVPVVSAVTEIDVDHAEFLGRDILAIAGEKAGIIKRGRPVVFGCSREDARGVLRAEARAQGAEWEDAYEDIAVRRTRQDWDGQRVRIDTAAGAYPPIRIPLLGAHQLKNAAVAVAALEAFYRQLGQDLPPDALKAGLESVSWPARLQVLQRDPVVVLDGAHNPNGAAALAGAIRDLCGRKPSADLLCGMMSDKDAGGALRELAGVCRRAWAVPVANPRAMPPGDLAAIMRAAGLPGARGADSWKAALAEATAMARAENGIVVIAGSLYLAGEILGDRAGGRDLFAAPEGGRP